MTEETTTPTIDLLEFSKEDIVELIRGIDRIRIERLVKQNKHLQRRVFPGFRPTHLPWNRRQVAPKLADDVMDDPHKLEVLLNLWILSNSDLLDTISELAPEDLREWVIETLARLGLEKRQQILWALQLDTRPEVQEMLEQGLAQELSEDASGLLSEARSTVLSETLEETRAQLSQTETQLEAAEDEIDRLRSVADRRSRKIHKWQETYKETEDERAHLEERLKITEENNQAAQEAISELEHQLGAEQELVQELRRSVRDLKSSLQAQAKDRETDQLLLELEDERKNTARLRLKVEGLTQDLQNAYEKRDKVRDQVNALQQEVNSLRHDKEVIIEEKRQFQEDLTDVRAEMQELRTQQGEAVYEKFVEAISLTDLGAAWLKHRREIRDHVQEIASTLIDEKEEAQLRLKKDELWEEWAERETALVGEALVTLAAYDRTGILPNTAELGEAQQLLALRWYLLEYMRQAIHHAQTTAFSV
jgi:DNA repair exonuclease SbcCD ATPase subunit